MLCLSLSCGNAQVRLVNTSLIYPAGSTVETRLKVPKGYIRESMPRGSFAYFLRHLPLQPNGSVVHLYNGEPKRNADVHLAVIKMDVGENDLQQCADAAMRLRGEYLFEQQKWDQLGFEFVKDQQLHFFEKEATDKTYASFRKWMNKVFDYANTRSLHHQLHSKKLQNIAIGDVLVQVGNPYGHAVTVVDVAVNNANGDKVFMLAQSYMPAQEIHILRNPSMAEPSPWYSLSEIKELIMTPEWDFTSADLKSWE